MDKNLGTTIKNLRMRKKMTLNDVAQNTGFSISFLSQLERGKSSTTLESLKKISQALGVKPGYFFEDTSERRPVQRQTVVETERMKKHNIYYKSLYDGIEQPLFVPHLVILKPRENGGDRIKHPGQEFLYVLEGQLTVEIADETHILNPSDSMMFDSGLHHYWYNYTDASVKFLCVNYDEIQ